MFYLGKVYERTKVRIVMSAVGGAAFQGQCNFRDMIPEGLEFDAYLLR